MRLFWVLCLSLSLVAQSASSRVTLSGHVRPEATAANDRGRVDSSLQLDRVMIMLKPSAAQQADLEQFLAQVQDASSPNFHKFLTPEQYSARFGAAQSDIDKITAWLGTSNLKVSSVSRGHNEITFSGNVRQVESALSTEIHKYNVKGEPHFANATDPSVPAELSGHILAIHGLNDFKLKPRIKSLKRLSKYTSGTTGEHYLAPDDVAALYDIKPILNSGITGTGQRIAIAGQSNILMSDIETFRSFFNLPANDPQLLLVPGSKDPGIVSGDQDEANLDIEFSGAVAKNATVIFVYSNDVFVSAFYAIDQSIAPVLSISYGDCESVTGINGTEGLKSLQLIAQQANAQGITWMAASGDSGAADCSADGLRGNAGAVLAVDAPGSIPEVTSVGGTEMNEGSGTYFASSNDLNHSSLSTYIPEMVWNDSAIDGEPSSSGGGVSSYFTKPAWQTGPGVPNDGFRDVPDIALDASNDHDPRMFYSAGSLGLVGGTSVSAPTFAGIVALLNQYQTVNGFQTTAGQGNVNPRLYAMAQSVPAAFHDVIVGNNIVDGCTTRSCTTGSVGYNAGVGFDLATGLGSLDVFNLITGWHQTSTTAKATAAMALTQAAATTFTATVSSSNGGSPTGTVTLIVGGSTVATGTLAASGTGKSSVTLAASSLPAGFDSVSAEYSGDANYAGAGASVATTVLPTSTMFISGIMNAASFKQAYSSGEIVAVFGTLLAGTTLSAPTVPLPTSLGGVSATVNGTAAPLYFVSPGQINLQIPYGSTIGAVATLTVTYNGQSASTEFLVTAASPGIFLDATGAPVGAQTAARGQTIAIYVTGQGAVSPQPASGALPSPNTVPRPMQNVVITVGGATVSQPYAFDGTPGWAIGLTQINFTVPPTASLGPQPLVVTIGSDVSAAATINIVQ